MNIFDAFPSKYLKAGDLQDQAVTLTITHIGIEHFDGDEPPRPIVHFEEAKRGLLLNRTNAKAIADLYSPETNNWLGRQISLFPTETTYRGAVVPCLRVRAPQAADRPEPPPAEPGPVHQPAAFTRQPDRRPIPFETAAADHGRNGLDL